MSSCPINTPASSVLVTTPRLNLPSLICPTQKPIASVRKIAISGYCRSVSDSHFIFCLAPPLDVGGSAIDRASPDGRQRGRLDELQAQRSLVAVDLLHIQLAHELDDPGADNLPRYHDREAGWIGDDEVGRHQLGAALQPLVDVFAEELY